MGGGLVPYHYRSSTFPGSWHLLLVSNSSAPRKLAMGSPVAYYPGNTECITLTKCGLFLLTETETSRFHFRKSYRVFPTSDLILKKNPSDPSLTMISETQTAASGSHVARRLFLSSSAMVRE
ncbi:hypothetical protein TNCV_2422371 [Trichonephila clavipes]|nr:hypothetical protein TNCV_2422371 [Trichonephila clavipes]